MSQHLMHVMVMLCHGRSLANEALNFADGVHFAYRQEGTAHVTILSSYVGDTQLKLSS